MGRTVSIPDDIHSLVVEKQLEIRKRYKINVRISDIIALIVKNNIDKVGEYLGLKETFIEPKKEDNKIEIKT